MLLWCDASANEDVIKEVSARCGHSKVKQFPSPMTFTRWLFQRPRGDVPGSYTLVVGWREAKPCYAAIEAAITGDVSGLRAEYQRWPLPEPTSADPAGGPPKEMGTVVGTVVVHLKDNSAPTKAIRWVKSCSTAFQRLQVLVAFSDRHILEVLNNSALQAALGGADAAPPAPVRSADVDLVTSPTATCDNLGSLVDNLGSNIGFSLSEGIPVRQPLAIPTRQSAGLDTMVPARAPPPAYAQAQACDPPLRMASLTMPALPNYEALEQQQRADVNLGFQDCSPTVLQSGAGTMCSLPVYPSRHPMTVQPIRSSVSHEDEGPLVTGKASENSFSSGSSHQQGSSTIGSLPTSISPSNGSLPEFASLSSLPPFNAVTISSLPALEEDDGYAPTTDLQKSSSSRSGCGWALEKVPSRQAEQAMKQQILTDKEIRLRTPSPYFAYNKNHRRAPDDQLRPEQPMTRPTMRRNSRRNSDSSDCDVPLAERIKAYFGEKMQTNQQGELSAIQSQASSTAASLPMYSAASESSLPDYASDFFMHRSGQSTTSLPEYDRTPHSMPEAEEQAAVELMKTMSGDRGWSLEKVPSRQGKQAIKHQVVNGKETRLRTPSPYYEYKKNGRKKDSHQQGKGAQPQPRRDSSSSSSNFQPAPRRNSESEQSFCGSLPDKEPAFVPPGTFATPHAGVATLQLERIAPIMTPW